MAVGAGNIEIRGIATAGRGAALVRPAGATGAARSNEEKTFYSRQRLERWISSTAGRMQRSFDREGGRENGRGNGKGGKVDAFYSPLVATVVANAVAGENRAQNGVRMLPESRNEDKIKIWISTPARYAPIRRLEWGDAPRASQGLDQTRERLQARIVFLPTELRRIR
ncbi:hypothetical protein E3N88_14623 [Mikania micrantha]|uniref:Uncharacterized protein n=1 Tax=Mikania micrantha TaxID=192012 RepID=A0A5N6P3X2_9ASTR|nr:hypothetical protein E3N88_14623 [Mikania micrantha]